MSTTKPNSAERLCACLQWNMASYKVALWLPEDFNIRGNAIIEQESDAIVRGALQRCLESVHRQISCVVPNATQDFLSHASLLQTPFSQYEINLVDGADPHRVECILDSLRASISLFDDTVWMENAAVFCRLTCLL